MKQVILWVLMSVIVSAAMTTGCSMVKEIPMEKTVTYPSITDLYYGMYGAHGKFESRPGEPFKLSLMVYRNLKFKAEEFTGQTVLYCGAIGGEIKQNKQTFTCNSKSNPNRVLFVSSCKIEVFRRMGSDSDQAKMTIMVHQNNRPDQAQLDNQALVIEKMEELKEKLKKEKEEKK